MEYHETLRKLHKNYGPVVRQDIGRRTVIHAFDPDHVRSVLNADGKTPTVPPLQETTQIYREKRQLSPGLGNTYVYHFISNIYSNSNKCTNTIFFKLLNWVCNQSKISTSKCKGGKVNVDMMLVDLCNFSHWYYLFKYIFTWNPALIS